MVSTYEVKTRKKWLEDEIDRLEDLISKSECEKCKVRWKKLVKVYEKKLKEEFGE